VGLGFAMVLLGVMGALAYGSTDRAWMTWARNQMVFPLGILVGYNAARTIRSAKLMFLTIFVCSLLSAVLIAVFVKEAGGDISQSTAGFDSLRAIQPSGDWGLMAYLVVVFAVVSRVRIMHPILAAASFVIGMAAFWSLPHRSNWVLGASMLFLAAVWFPTVAFKRRVIWMAGGTLITATLLLGLVIGYSKISGKDFSGYLIDKRLNTMRLGENLGEAGSLTGTRWHGIVFELDLWSQSPLFGVGYGYDRRDLSNIGASAAHHNVWTSVMAESGLIGLAGYLVPLIGAVAIGRRMWRDQTERWLSLIGIMGALTAAAAIGWATLTLSINHQRGGLSIALLFGMLYRYRALQLTLAREQAADEYGSLHQLPSLLEEDEFHGSYGSFDGRPGIQH